MKLIDLLEAIPLGQAMQYRRAWDPDTYKELFMGYPIINRDKHGFRIYLHYITVEKQNVVPKNISNALEDKGYKVVDYISGKAREIDGIRTMRIGKLLADHPALQKQFNEDPQRSLSKKSDKLVVVSRHPYDVAGMSTGRGWKSCMNLTDGEKRHYVMRDVKNGTLIAYLIHKHDKNIENPISRMLIKTFQYEHDPSDTLLASDEVQYGTADEGFGLTVQRWLNKINGPDKTGFYCMHPKLSQEGKPKFYSHPDESVHLEQVEEDPDALQFIKHPSLAVQMAAVTQDGHAIRWIVNPSAEVQLAAVKQSPSAINHVISPSASLQLFAVEQNPGAILYIEFPTEEAQLAAVELYPEILDHLEKPSSKAVEAAKQAKEREKKFK